MPTTRALTPEEEAELNTLYVEGEDFLELPEDLDLAGRLEALRLVVDQVRAGEELPEPYDEADELAYVLGTLWGRWVAERSGWAWTWLTLDDGFEGYAMVPEDEAYAVWPHHFLYGLLELDELENTTAVLAECIWGRELPPSEAGALVLLG